MLYQAGPSSCGGPTEHISSFLDLLLQPIAQKKGYYTLYKLHWKHRIPSGSYFSYTGRVFILH